MHRKFKQIVIYLKGAKVIVSKLKPEKGHISDEFLAGSETRHIYTI